MFSVYDNRGFPAGFMSVDYISLKLLSLKSCFISIIIPSSVC